MGHIFQQTYTVFDKRKQKRVTKKTKKWYAEYRDAMGNLQRIPGYRDRRATLEMLAQLEREADQQRAGILPPTLVDQRRPLVDRLTEYLDMLRARNDGEQHVVTQGARIAKTIDGCRFRLFADITADKVSGFLLRLRSRKAHPLSIATSNHYLTAFKGFCRWLAESDGLPNPVARLRRLSTETDRRRPRRALAEAELQHLLATAAASPVSAGMMPGPCRALLYTLAAYTGLRSTELGTLTAGSIRLEDAPPCLVVQAGYSKRRRQDRIPLHPALHARLAAWIATLPADHRLFPGTWAKNRHAAEVLRVDLAAAGIAYQDGQGRYFDFHALRGQFLTGLARAGVHPRVAQKLARHSDINLTMRAYTHLEDSELANELSKLPKPPENLG